jgi:nitrogen regulatory protein PII
MRQLIVVVKPFKAQAVLEAIADLEIEDCIIREVKGFGRQKSYLGKYLGSEYEGAFLPKVEIILWVHDDLADETVQRIMKAARTGRIGDGKIFVVQTAWPETLEF